MLLLPELCVVGKNLQLSQRQAYLLSMPSIADLQTCPLLLSYFLLRLKSRVACTSVMHAVVCPAAFLRSRQMAVCSRAARSSACPGSNSKNQVGWLQKKKKIR